MAHTPERAKLFAREHALLIALLVITACVYFGTIRAHHHWGGDFSMYIAEAKNIATGHPYADTGFVWVPGLGEHYPRSYPPVFPLILAPFYAWFGNDYYVFKIVVQVLLLASLPFYYFIARRMDLSRPAAALAVAMFGLSAVILELKESICSDTAYLLFAGAFLCAALSIYSRELDKRRPLASAIALTVLFLLAYGARSAGLALAFALGTYEVWSARRVRRFGVAAAACLIVTLALYTLIVYDSRQYGGEFPIDPGAYLRNALYYLKAPTELWAGSPSAFRYLLTLFAGALAAMALIRRFVRGPGVVEFYAVVSIALAVVYTSGMGERYLIPFLALFPAYVLDGASWLSEWLPTRAASIAWGTATALFVLAITLNVVHIQRGPVVVGVGSPAFIAVCDHLVKSTPRDSVLVSWNPRVFSLYTGRRGTHYAHTSDPARFGGVLAQTGADHAIVYRESGEDTRWLEPFIRSLGPAAQLTYEKDGYRVYTLSSLVGGEVGR